jgi:phosphatidylglycerol:prolipoprotein diacylglycerol transferase
VVPFLEIPPLTIGGWRLYPFTLLVITAVLFGHFHFLIRTRKQGIDTPISAGMSLWTILGGFIGSHLIKLAYNPAMLRRSWIAALDVYNGMSSFGGFLGALGAMTLYFHIRGIDPATRRRMTDSAAYVLPFAWSFGRAGCAIAHDHPGIRTEGWLAVAYPGGARYDLGLLELLFVVLFFIPAFLWLDRKPRAAGFYPGLFLAVYGVFRLALDQLHDAPPRYLGVTMDQWAASCAILAGAWFLLNGHRQARLASGVPDRHDNL